MSYIKSANGLDETNYKACHFHFTIILIYKKTALATVISATNSYKQTEDFDFISMKLF